MAADPHSPPRFDSLHQEVYLGLWRTYDRLRALEDELFASYELTAQQYNVLRLLKAARPDSVPTLTLADRLVSRAPDITRMIDRLEFRGLVIREKQANDRRVVRVRITDAGQKLVAEIAGPLAACHARQLGHLDASDLKQLSALLREARRPHEPDGSVWRLTPVVVIRSSSGGGRSAARLPPPPRLPRCTSASAAAAHRRPLGSLLSWARFPGTIA